MFRHRIDVTPAIPFLRRHLTFHAAYAAMLMIAADDYALRWRVCGMIFRLLRYAAYATRHFYAADFRRCHDGYSLLI